VLITGIDAEERGEVSSEGESEELEMGGGSREQANTMALISRECQEISRKLGPYVYPKV
jgi:hypothetical protein